MNLSDGGAVLIENSEGFRSRPYRDPVGIWTIGFGSTKGVGPRTPPMTRSAARSRMKREVDATYGAAVNQLWLPLNQNQYDALCSFVYNLGPGAVGSDTTIGQRLRARRWRPAADAMLSWDKAGRPPRRLEGLTRRRREERRLFLRKAPAVDKLLGLTAAERKIAKGRIDAERAIRAHKNVPANRARSVGYRIRIRACQRRLWLKAKRHGWGKGYSGRGHRWKVLDAVVEGRIR